MNLMQATIAAILKKGNGPSGDVTAEAVAAAIEDMTAAQATQAREDLGAAPKEQTVTVAGTTPTIAAADNHYYKCGEVTTLTFSSLPNEGLFGVEFTSGATATQIVWPSGAVVALPDGVSIEANKLYELSVRCGSPVKVAVGEWPVPSAQGAS